MFFQENDTVELKEIFVDDIGKEAIAFANSDGGKIFIGVLDDGTAVNLDNPDELALRISNMVRNSIKPNITIFLHYGTIEKQEKKSLSTNKNKKTINCGVNQRVCC